MAVGVDHTYLSKIENAKLTFGDCPSEELICKLAEALEADPNELLLLAEKIPPTIKQRVRERPDVFLKLATLDDATLDALLVRSSQTAGGRAAGDALPVRASRRGRAA